MSAGTIERVETERLTCERLCSAHTSEMITLLLDPRVAEMLWPFPEGPAEEDVSDGVRRVAEHWERHGFGLWLLRDRETGAMVGRGGLQHTYATGLNAVEVAWAVVPERWGQGIATELARAALDVAFNHLALLEVVALTLPHNIASRRVMEKTGFAYQRDIVHAGLPHVLYVRRAD